MEPEETTVQAELKEAFNRGYLIGKNRPEVAESLLNALNKDSIMPEATLLFYKGMEEARVKELSIEENLRDEFQKLRGRNSIDRDSPER